MSGATVILLIEATSNKVIPHNNLVLQNFVLKQSGSKKKCNVRNSFSSFSNLPKVMLAKETKKDMLTVNTDSFSFAKCGAVSYVHMDH